MGSTKEYHLCIQTPVVFPFASHSSDGIDGYKHPVGLGGSFLGERWFWVTAGRECQIHVSVRWTLR